ncbi:discoidin domain-containing protein [Phytohabitans sp. LJ34]|uniref:discoidin domain-containing protein n=1 Tax=Phytohabitans sp. LJ34 TaxID=3452217 RepID=UPI003F8B51A2
MVNRVKATALALLGGATLAGGLALAAPAFAATDYYVSPTGRDGNTGTSAAAPFATIQKALDTAPSGATIHLASGSYRQDAVTTRTGVTVTGPATAVVLGAGGSRVFQVRHDAVTLSGFTVDGRHASGDSASSYRDKLVYVMSTSAGDGVDRLRILGMTIRNAGGECVRLRYLVTNAEVANSRIGPCGAYDFQFAGGGKNGEGVYIGTAPEQQGQNGAPDGRADVSRDNRVHHNTFDTRGNECVDIKENSTANVVEQNTCTGQLDPESAGFDARGSGNTFRYNTSSGNKGAGIRFGGDRATDGRANNAYGNVIEANAAGGIKFQAAPQGTVCGNTMSGNTKGDSVGTYGGQFRPTQTCPAGTVPTPSPTPTATVSPTVQPTTSPTAPPTAPGDCAISASGDDGNAPANTRDGSLATRWSDEGYGAWIRFDLCATRSVDDIAIAWHRGDQRTAEFTVQASVDGTSWRTIVPRRHSSGDTVAPETYEAADGPARWIRVVGYGNAENNWTSITEVSWRS